MKMKLQTTLAATTGIALLTHVIGVAPAAAAPKSNTPTLVHVSAQELDALRREVAQARARDARSFAEVGRIVALAPEMNALARARKAPIALYIAKLGPSALMPALELLALEQPRAVPAASMQAVRRELIEAVGLLRDPRALGVLSAILDDNTEDLEVTRTAAEAIARIGTDAAADQVVSALAKASGDRARAIASGMGECRRLRVTEAIAEQLRTTTDEATARAAIRALGRAGNAWVWSTLSDRREEELIRSTAARALLEAFVRHDGEVRTAASNALMIVDARETAGWIAEARKAAARPETALALDALAARLARNPTRTHAHSRR